MTQQPSPLDIRELRVAAIIAMAAILAGAMVLQHFVPTPPDDSGSLEQKVDKVERDARSLLQELQQGDIDLATFLSQLQQIGVHPAFLAVLAVQGTAILGGIAGLLALAVVYAVGVRIKPRGNWAPGTPWLPLDALEVILFFGCCQVAVSVAWAVFMRIWTMLLGAAPPSPTEQLHPGHLAALYIIPAAATLALLWRRTPGGLRRLWTTLRARTAPVLTRLLQGAGGYAAALPLLVVAKYLNPFGGDTFSSNPVISMLLEPRSVAAWILLLVVIGLCAPVFEEVMFRGCAYPAFRRRWGVGVAVLASGLLFGAIHGQLGEFVPLTVLGIVFAVLYELSGSVLPCIVAHAAVNTITLLQIMLLSGA